MRTYILAVTGMAIAVVAACGSYGTSVVAVENAPPVATVLVAITPAAVLVGQVAHATAALQDLSGNPLSGRTVTWGSNNTSVAVVSAAGDVSAVAPGTASISASSEGKTASAALTVSAPAAIAVASVSVSPATSTLQIGGTVQLSPTTRDANNNVLTGRVVAWSSANVGIASVGSNGQVTAVSSGTTQITASSEGKTGSATIIVSPPAQVPVATVSVSPASGTMVIGSTLQLAATTRDANNNVLTGRTVTWSSSNITNATVNANGLVSTVSTGAATITATSEGKSGSSAITVDPAPPPPPAPVATVSISPATSSVGVGGTVQLSATTLDANNNVLTGRVVTWSSSNTGIASVANGVVNGLAVGTTQITAMSEGQTSAAATVTVTTAPPPPPPPVGGSNEPSGLAMISDRPFNSTTCSYTAGEDGWWDSMACTGMAIVQDATAPKSPNSIARMIYPAGFGGGYSPASLERGVGVTTLYVAAWVRFSANWQSHTSGVNKILHLWINGANRLVITAAGYDAYGPLTARISLQGISAGGNNNDGSGTFESSVQFVRGQWHKIEVVAVANTSGANGSVKLFIDGVLATQCSGIAFVPGSGSWDLVQWSPTWGGTGQIVTATQYMDMDHIYLSGK